MIPVKIPALVSAEEVVKGTSILFPAPARSKFCNQEVKF